MLNNLKQRKSDGFTIIEVMIVLAIAGLIMLIVFLAVPALQRNAHNTSLKNDVASLLGIVNEYTNNNNGSLPANQTTAQTLSGNTATVGLSCSTPGANCATTKVSTNATSATIVSTVPGSAPAVGAIVIIKTAVCNGNVPTATGATGRNLVAYYTLEGGVAQCQAS